MLTLPPKMQAALDRGDFQPVTYLEVTTAVLDAPPAQQTLNYFGAVAGRDGAELLYPAQPGDPTQTGVIIQEAWTDHRIGLGTGIGYLARESPSGGTIFIRSSSPIDYIGRTFTLGEDILTPYQLKSLTVILKRTHTIANRWRIRARLYEVDADGNLIGFRNRDNTIHHHFGGGIQSPTDFAPSSLALDTATEVTFAFDQTLIPGQRYALLLFPLYTDGDVMGSATDLTVNVFWMASRKQNHREFTFTESERPGYDLSLRVTVAAYSYDGVSNPRAEVWFDLQGTPVSEGFISIRDLRPLFFDPVTGTTKKTDIDYRLWTGATLGAKTTDLGDVVDGSRVSTFGRFYVLECFLRTAATETLLRTPSFISANLIFAQVVAGSPRTYAFSSHALPFTLAPSIDRISNLATRLDLGSYVSQRGEVTVRLMDHDGSVTRMATEEHLLNLPAEVRVGHLPDAVSKNDLLQVFQGKLGDCPYQEGILDLKIVDRTKDLNIRIPKAADGGLQRRDYRGKELVDVLEEIINEAGVSRRYVDTASFTTLKTYLKGSDAVSLWVTHRILTEPTEARKLVDEILQIIGAYLVVREEGVYTLIQYPRSGNAVDDWDDKVLAKDDSQPAGLAKSIVNQPIVLFDANGDGKLDETDYAGANPGAIIGIDPDAQEAWAPGAERAVFDSLMKTLWLGPEYPYNGWTVSKRVARRDLQAKSNGAVPYHCRTGYDRIKVQVGDFVNITSPVYLRKHKLGMTAKKFMVLFKDPSDDQKEIRWQLQEVIDANRPPTAFFTVNVSAGTPPFTVNFDGTGSVDPDGTISTYEWDIDYDGVNFTVDYTGATGSHEYLAAAAGVKTIALRVTDNNGAQHLFTRPIRVRKAPEAIIHYQISAPDQPLFVMLTSGSFGTTGAIVKTEWDLSYDGVTFNSEVVGESATVNLPYQEITVALRVTDEDGLTDIETRRFSGKALAPATPTGFFWSQIGDKLSFNWDPNLEVDLYGYEVRYKYEPTGALTATWDNSDPLAQEILTAHLVSVTPRPYGYYTFLLKAINTTGRYSINPVAIFGRILDPQDRNALVVQDERAGTRTTPGGVADLGKWPGTKSQLVYDVGGDRWWINSPGTIDEMNDTPLDDVPDDPIALKEGTYSQGTYETGVIDLGAVLSPVRLSVQVTTSSLPAPDNTQAVVEFRTSDDNVVWTDYAPIKIGDLSFRYVQILVTAKNLDGASNIAIENVVTTIDVPDLIDSEEDIDVAIGGTTVQFHVAFNAIPVVVPSIQNMTSAHFVEVYNKTLVSVGLRVRRASDGADVGSAGTRLVDIQMTGF